jgi:hypothetical protein
MAKLFSGARVYCAMKSSALQTNSPHLSNPCWLMPTSSSSTPRIPLPVQHRFVSSPVPQILPSPGFSGPHSGVTFPLLFAPSVMVQTKSLHLRSSSPSGYLSMRLNPTSTYVSSISCLFLVSYTSKAFQQKHLRARH